MSLKIRSSLDREDWNFIRELCSKTGNAGEPIDPTRWPFFGERWVGAYEKLRPEFTYVVEDAGERLGYLTGCPDTERFECEKKWLFDFPLYLRVRMGVFEDTPDLSRFTQRFLGKNPGPEECFPEGVTRSVLHEYPAHLHMNFRAESRGKGSGRVIVEYFREHLAQIGVRGIHLYCGPKSLPFYERVGFTELDRIEFRPGVIVYRLGSRF